MTNFPKIIIIPVCLIGSAEYTFKVLEIYTGAIHYYRVRVSG